MKKIGIKCISFTRKSRKYSSYRGVVGKIAKNLIHRRFGTSLARQKLTTDTSEFKYYESSKEGHVTIKEAYLDAYLDMFNGEIISFRVSKRPNAQAIMEALDEAITSTKVCIDDFALKKRHTYGTIMIDIDTHKIIDLIPSREWKDVQQWLESYPNLTHISRDGSTTYNKAIDMANPKNIQISDRFHLIKNLIDYCKEALKYYLPAKLSFPLAEKDVPSIIIGLTPKQKAGKAEICIRLSMDTRTLSLFTFNLQRNGLLFYYFY